MGNDYITNTRETNFLLKTINFIFPYSGANKTIEKRNNKRGGDLSKRNVYIIFKKLFSQKINKKKREREKTYNV